MHALETPRPRTRWELLQTLNNLDPTAREAIPTLEKLTTHPDPDFRAAVRNTLKKVTPDA
jgi:hypothetical protein